LRVQVGQILSDKERTHQTFFYVGIGNKVTRADSNFLFGPGAALLRSTRALIT
jgi:hypothetical protein